jgi:hypothetical protein
MGQRKKKQFKYDDEDINYMGRDLDDIMDKQKDLLKWKKKVEANLEN